MRRGIIKGIDEDLSKDEINNTVESSIKVLKVKRLTQKETGTLTRLTMT